MNKEMLLDDILKEKALKEKLALPKDLDQKINDTLKNLPKRKKHKHKAFRVTSTAAAAVLFAVICFSTAFPAYARNMPVVSSVFQYLSDKNLIDKEYVMYNSDLNLSKTSNDVTVTINSIVYDGIDLSIGYTVESKNEMNSVPHMLYKEFKINGKSANFGSGGTGQLLDKNTYVGVDSFSVAQDYLPKELRSNNYVKLPDSFIMDLNIQEFSNGLKGNWDFKFRVSLDKIKGKAQATKISVDLTALRPGLKVTEVIFTPVNTAIRTVEDFNTSNRDIGYVVYDDKGRLLNRKGGTGSGNPKVGSKYSEYTFRNVYEDTKFITFIPIVEKEEFRKNIENSKGSYTFEKKEMPLNIEGTTILSLGKVGDYKINKVEFLQDKTLVYYECTGLLWAVRPYLPIITDGQGKDYEFYRYPIKDLENHNYIVELPPLQKYEQYKLNAVDMEKIEELREDYKFTIQVR